MTEYAERSPIELGEYYTTHIMAMTAEELHDKSSIAAELAYRDKYIAELEEAIYEWREERDSVREEREQLKAENQRLRNALETAWERMDRARKILTDGKPSKHNNWGMLDTTLDRQALEKKI
jgi:regulator of replication initiation timing